MKNSLLVFVVLLSAMIGLAGCGSKSKADTAKLESAFASAEAPLKSEVQTAIDAIKKEDLASALASLQKTYARAKLTDAQKAAIKDTVESLQKLIAEGVNKSVQDSAAQATKAAEDLKKNIK